MAVTYNNMITEHANCFLKNHGASCDQGPPTFMYKKGMITNMMKKIILLTTLLFTFNASTSSGTNTTLEEGEQVPNWSRTFNLAHYTKLYEGTGLFKISFGELSRNPFYIIVNTKGTYVVIKKEEGPLIFEKDINKFGLTPFKDCELSFYMSEKEFRAALYASFYAPNVTELL